jgi:hypothetical protein
MSMIYSEDDKEGLRRFLRQPSAVAGKTNGEQLGLQIDDMNNWENNEAWVEKIRCLKWNDELPKRLIEIDWDGLSLAGMLDAGKWRELTFLWCLFTSLSVLDLSMNKELCTLEYDGNQI